MKQQHPDVWWKTPDVQVTALVYDAIQESNWLRRANPEIPFPEPLLSEPTKPEAPTKPSMSARDIRAEIARRQRAA